MRIRMMCISKHAIIIMLAASSALFAQAQNQSGVPDVRQIVQESIAATQRSWQGRIQYSYLERDEDRRLDIGWAGEVPGGRCLENDSGRPCSIRATLGTQWTAYLRR